MLKIEHVKEKDQTKLNDNQLMLKIKQSKILEVRHPDLEAINENEGSEGSVSKYSRGANLHLKFDNQGNNSSGDELVTFI